MSIENNNIKLNLDNEYFKIDNGVLVHIKKFEPKIVIPEGVESIRTDLFFGMSPEEKREIVNEGKKIEEIVFPNSLKEIYGGAFKYCWGQYCFFDLKNVKLPPSVQFIGANAFSNNSNLETLELHENIQLDSYPFVLDRDLVTIDNGSLLKMDQKMYVTKIPSKIIINYTNFEKLSKLLDELINSKNFKFGLAFVPKFEFELKGPKLSKLETLKIYRKIILTRARRIQFTNQNESLDLVDYQQSDINPEEIEGKSK